MAAYLIRRLLWIVPVILTVSVVTFFLMYRAPGGPWDKEKAVPAATRRNLNAKFGLDKPLWFNRAALRRERDGGEDNPVVLTRALLDGQFFNYMFGVLRFD